MDWDYWMGSSRSLPHDHKTIAREAVDPDSVSGDPDHSRGGTTYRYERFSREFTALKSAIRLRNYAISTEHAYQQWLYRFIRFHKYRSPDDLSENEVVAFLEYLAVKRNVAASTQNQALNALMFYYKHVLKNPLGELGEIVRAKRPINLPVVTM